MPARPLTKSLTPFARRLLVALLVFEALLAVLHVVTRLPATPAFWARLFDMGEVLSLGSGFTMLQMLALALVSFANGLYSASGKAWGRVYWWFLTAVFLYQAADEYYTLYQSIVVPGLGAPLAIVAYAAAGLALVGLIVAAHRFGLRDEVGPLGVILLGFAITALGDPLLDNLDVHFLCRHISSQILGPVSLCHKTVAFEEFFEIAGSSVVLAAFLSQAQARLEERRWQVFKRLLVGSGALFVFLYAGRIWLFPAVENRLLAQPVQAEYGDGALALVGYRASPDVAAPGGKVTVRLYWQAGQPLTSEYFVSAHLVSQPEIESMAQSDLPLGGGWTGWSTETWLPGVVMRDVVRLQLPGDLPTPASYWLILRVWETSGNHRRIDLSETTDLPLTRSDRPTVEPDVLVLFSLPVLGDAPVEPPPVEADYRFADGFTLTGYALPNTGELGGSLPLAFWWTAQADGGGDYTQFIHLLQVGGDEFTGHDQPPFGGSFPTSDWPAGMAAMDAVSVPLPEDLPPGQYHVYTGLYAPATGERQSVAAPDGQPVPDFAIDLGTVTLEQ